ncbi:DNA mismatch repair endonuclease MutL [Bacillus sp. 03113]|uniref:DNA mismatch repair endonuclease MutL n=1 Tax=Bacillus sp. 03113 TaxID=2578211 RepID=UPI00114192F6|nr:DNA mismatch repair endonuclease MutL [Bacillus sp. 03113]
MAKIIQLDDALSNKIAAGEVVERPASVVKELVENAIDAGSSIIEIELEEAGLSKIRIVDNGEGMEEEDVLTAFKRHATSKIKDENDLFRVQTLGFRGEALPSIASVSRLEMKTSIGEAGTRLLMEGGKVTSFEKSSSRKGTEFIITDLFFNTPARLKYMKSIHTELGNVTDIVNRIALAHPEVSFRFIHNDRKLLHTNGNGDVRQVLAAIYGVNIAKKMIPIHGRSLDYEISGFAALPEVTRASRNYTSTMINGRFIKNYPLVKAILEGYHTLLPIGRFPIVFINIIMDPILVDVNVHPSKLEVRISKEQELLELVANTIKSAFKEKELIPAGLVREKMEQPKLEQTMLEFDHAPQKQKELKESAPIVQENEEPFLFVEKSPITKKISRDLPQEINAPLIEHNKNEGAIDSNEVSYHEENNSLSMNDKDDQAARIPPFYPIGQMHGTYIFAQNEKGLYIIDQHAAQERINYEYFKEKVGQVHNELQDLLIPITMEFSIDECMKINEYKPLLEDVGVFLEDFGMHSFIVRSHPQWFPKGEEQQIIEEMIEQLLIMKKVDIKKLREEAAIMMSCKAAIKANRYLRNDEIEALLEKLRNTNDPFTCPHGRPIIIHYTTYDMEKMFKRVM